MSSGGHSFHKKDWAKLAGLAALGTAGAGAAGFGPMASLFGGGSGLLGGASTVGAGLADSTLAGGLGAGAADEAVGSLAGGAAGNPASIAFGNLPYYQAKAAPYLNAISKGSKAYNASNSLLGGGGMGGGPAPAAGPRPPMPGQLQSSTAILGGGQGAQQLPPELMFLPSSDPRVQQWYAQHPQGGMYG